MSAKDIDRDKLLIAFDRLGSAAIEAGVKLDLLVYGGSALMFASNFRWSTGDVDIAPIEPNMPDWLQNAIRAIAAELGFSEKEDWLNSDVAAHLSGLATKHDDHLEFGTFPRTGEAAGLTVFVPTAEYMLALKLKAMRVNDPVKGPQEREDIQNLLQINDVRDVDHAIRILGKYFPVSAKSPEKHAFLLKHMFTFDWDKSDAPPSYPTRDI